MSNDNYDYNAQGGQLPPDQTQRMAQPGIGGYDPNQPLAYPEQAKDTYGTPVKPYPGGNLPQPLPPTPQAPIQPYQLPYQPAMPYSQVDIERIRADAAKAVKDRQGLRAHLTSYIFVMSLLTAIWLITSLAAHEFIYFWPIWAAFGWGIGLFAHYMSVYGGWARQSEAARQREIDAEVRRRLGQ
jgi:2TM domain